MADTNNFLTNLGGVLDQQFLSGDSKNASLDILQYGQSNRYGTLGDFNRGVNQTVDRSYTEEGSFRNDFYNPKPKHLDILMQEPDVTVLVKKRAFSSLAENYRTDLMDAQEKMFFRVTKILFQNKCRQLSAYEKLAKISQVSTDIGRVDLQLLPIIFAATDTLTQTPGSLGLNTTQDSINGSLSGFKSIVDRVREIVAFSRDKNYTTWLTNIPDSFRSNFGEGTGVIEFTNVNSLTTTTTLKFAKGSFSLNFSDPYEIMLITNMDIEQAIYDANNRYYNNSFVQLGITSLDQIISSQKILLNSNRANRGANPIQFVISSNVYGGSVVSAVIETSGLEINFDASSIGIGSANIDPSGLEGSDLLGNDGLAASEISLFNSIVSMLYSSITIAATSRRQAIVDNQDPSKSLNAVRKRMRLNYANKLLIQPMDNVHIFMNSKKRVDTKITGGLQSSFAALGFLQGVNNLTQDIKDTFAISENYAIEKSIYVGSNFPNWLWLILRNQFVSDTNGMHVFGGIVEDASSTYNNGVFSVRASGTDNAGYFNYGVVNFKPSVDVFNGALYDPLTPFKLEFDAATGALKYQADGAPTLLDENKYLFGSAFVRNKNGLFAGIKPTEEGYLVQDADRIKNNSVRKVFYDPDGMVYRWKEGIATLVLFGDSYESNPATGLAPSITDDPFAGQDIMNVLSLLITGEPYNFATFYKSATQINGGGLKRDPGSNQDPSVSYFRGLSSQLKARNSMYGNFVPFKQLTVDEATFTQIMNNQLNVTKFDSELQDLLQQRATLSDQLAIFGKTSQQTVSGSNPSDQAISAKINTLDQQINYITGQISTTLSSPNSPLLIVGNDVSYDYDSSNLNSGSQTNIDAQSRKELRRKIALLTKRLAWKVRANEDVNLLIVDDSYDKDYDIQAFEKVFTNPELFKSEYITIADKITNVVNLIKGMEIYCDTQGHIQIRNPKYNKMPSSVFYRMFQLKNELGIQIFPQFLEDLFVNQLTTLLNNIGVLEDEIRFYCLALGKATDADCLSFINSTATGSTAGGAFKFLSSENTGKVTNMASLNLAAMPDIIQTLTSSALSSGITSQVGISVFGILGRASLIQSISPSSNSSTQNNLPQKISQITQNQTIQTRAQLLSSRLQQTTGQPFNINQLFSNTTNATIASSNISSVDILRASNDIAQFISQRQNAVKSAANAIKNMQETVTLTQGGGGTGNESGGNDVINPSLYATKNIPRVFENMIEDETYDDLGINSGRRYVLKNRDVISYTIYERRPPFTSIEVTGRLSGLFVQNNQLPQDLQVFQQGNALVTAAAVDYDMWRMYGMSLPTGIDAPFLSDPNTQCAPYAVSLLNQARKEIFGATVEIVGNEYQQPGEVVYLENRDMLFYVESVTHNFTFGRSFTTSLELTYGHNAGEYIPTFLDVIGKVLYNNKDITNLVHKKQGSVFNQEHVGTICGSINTATIQNAGNSNAAVNQNDITDGQFGDVNRLALQNIMNYGAQTLALNSDSLNPTLEIRVYFNSEIANLSSASAYSTSLQQTVNNYLIGKTTLQANTNPTADQNTNNNSLSAFKTQIQMVSVDCSSQNVGEFRYPSSQAFYYARKAIDESSSSLNGGPAQNGPQLQMQIDNIIYSYIVDVWIVFNNPVSPNPKPTLTTFNPPQSS
jgi:hypothetical protein